MHRCDRIPKISKQPVPSHHRSPTRWQTVRRHGELANGKRSHPVVGPLTDPPGQGPGADLGSQQLPSLSRYIVCVQNKPTNICFKRPSADSVARAGILWRSSRSKRRIVDGEAAWLMLFFFEYGKRVRAGHARPVPCRPVPVAETPQGSLWVPTATAQGTPRYPGTQRTVNGPANGQRTNRVPSVDR
jgi:hypothetical protein